MGKPSRYFTPGCIFLRLNQIGHIVKDYDRAYPAAVMRKQGRSPAKQFLTAVRP